MNRQAPPPAGYTHIDAVHAAGIVKQSAVPWIEDQLRSAATLYEAVADRSLSVPATGGRGAVRFINAPSGDGEWVVRHSMRGGLLGPLWVDRYPRVGTPRPVRELQASARLIDAGVNTPRVIAALHYPAGLFYRADIVTRRVPGVPLIQGLSGSAEGAGQHLEQIAELIEQLAQVGALHVDLNAHNVLVDPDGKAAPWVLDLDGMRFDRGARQAASAMTNRLLRSLKKLGATDEVLNLAASTLRATG